MRIGQDTKKVESTEITEKIVREKLRQHNKNLEENIKKLQAAQNMANQLSQQQIMLQGAIRGLQDLLPKEKNEEIVKTDSATVDGQDVPPTDNAKPGPDEKPGEGTEKASECTERQEPEAEVQ